MSLDDLFPRIRELRSCQDELNKARVQDETDLVAEQVPSVDSEEVKVCLRDLRSLVVEAELIERKASLHSSVQRIEVDKKQVTIHYRALWQKKIRKDTQEAEVLPIVPPAP